MGEESMQLKKSVDAFGTPDFQTVLADEIEQHSHSLPLNELMGNAGWLPDQADVAVGKHSGDKDTITAEISVYFDEDHPSGCADLVRTTNHRAEFKVSIDRGTGHVDFELVRHENLSDRENRLEDLSPSDRADRDYRRSEF
jgi:hypothetical protein